MKITREMDEGNLELVWSAVGDSDVNADGLSEIRLDKGQA